VESVRGPVSVVYGQTPPGGLVNIVSKQPTTQPLHEVFFETGSYGRARRLRSGRRAQRLGQPVLSADRRGHDHRHPDRLCAPEAHRGGPALTWTPDNRNTLTIIGNYQKDPQAGAFNYVPAVGTVLPGKAAIPARSTPAIRAMTSTARKK
jgi:iron complex outermembrane receptor protein